MSTVVISSDEDDNPNINGNLPRKKFKQRGRPQKCIVPTISPTNNGPAKSKSPTSKKCKITPRKTDLIITSVELNDNGDDEEYQLDLHTKTKTELAIQKALVPKPKVADAIKPAENFPIKTSPSPSSPTKRVVHTIPVSSFLPEHSSQPIQNSITITPISTGKGSSSQGRNSNEKGNDKSKLEINQSTNLFILDPRSSKNVLNNLDVLRNDNQFKISNIQSLSAKKPAAKRKSDYMPLINLDDDDDSKEKVIEIDDDDVTIIENAKISIERDNVQEELNNTEFERECDIENDDIMCIETNVDKIDLSSDEDDDVVKKADIQPDEAKLEQGNVVIDDESLIAANVTEEVVPITTVSKDGDQIEKLPPDVICLIDETSQSSTKTYFSSTSPAFDKINAVNESSNAEAIPDDKILPPIAGFDNPTPRILNKLCGLVPGDKFVITSPTKTSYSLKKTEKFVFKEVFEEQTQTENKSLEKCSTPEDPLKILTDIPEAPKTPDSLKTHAASDIEMSEECGKLNPIEDSNHILLSEKDLSRKISKLDASLKVFEALDDPSRRECETSVASPGSKLSNDFQNELNSEDSRGNLEPSESILSFKFAEDSKAPSDVLSDNESRLPCSSIKINKTQPTGDDLAEKNNESKINQEIMEVDANPVINLDSDGDDHVHMEKFESKSEIKSSPCKVILKKENTIENMIKARISAQFTKTDSCTDDDDQHTTSTLFPENSSTIDLFLKFIEICQLESIPIDSREVIQSKIENAKRRYEKLNEEYRDSPEFRLLLQKKITEIETKPKLAIIAFDAVLTDLRKHKLKLQTEDKEGATDDLMELPTGIDKEKQIKIRKLEMLLKLLQKKIYELEVHEMNVHDEEWDEDSAYIQIERYYKKASSVYAKMCQLCSEDPKDGRPTFGKINFQASQYPQINKAVSKLYNKKKEFPDFRTVDKCMRKTMKKHKLKLKDSQIEHEAEHVFKALGRLLQRKRQKDFKESLTCYPKPNAGMSDSPSASSTSTPIDLNVFVDPASTDQELDKRLRENLKAGQKKMSEVMATFTRKQIDGEDEVLSDASVKSVIENDDAESSSESDNDD